MSKYFVVYSLLILSAAAGLFAQTESATVVGTVTDTSGAVVPNVTVTLRDTGTNAALTVQSAADGNYASPPLRPGAWEVSVTAPGFARIIQNLNLDVDQHARIDFTLKPGQATDSVTVEANAEMLDTQSATLGNVRTTQAINDLPLNGRNFVSLTYLAPGTSSSGRGPAQAGSTSNQLGLQGVSVNGIRNTSNTIIFDGINVQDNQYGMMVMLPSQDGIEEFKMQSSGRDATTGRTGGALINLVTKSGANAFHGSAFEFLRNADLDARNYFDPPKIPAFHQNQFGASLGGRIVKDKTFFFVDIQKSYTIQGQSYVETVPTALEHTGDFSQLSSKIYNPYTTTTTNGVTTRQQFTGNVIPPSLISSIGATTMGWYQLPTLPGLANNYSSNPARTLAPLSSDARVDHRFTDKDSLFVRYSNQTSGPIINPSFFPTFGAQGGDYTNNGQQVVIGYTRVFSPSFLSEFRAGYTRAYDTEVPLPGPTALGTHLMDQLGIPGIDGYGLPAQSVGAFEPTGYAYVGGAFAYISTNITNNYQYGAHFNWIHDKHTIRWGYDLFRRGMNMQEESPAGVFTFTGQFTQNPASAAGTGSGLADLLLGLDATANQVLAQETGVRHWEHGWYIQDDYRVNKKLTLNAGLRYEIVSPWSEIHGRMSAFDIASNNNYPVNTPQHPGNALYYTNYLNFALRVGLSYQLTSKTVIRSGFGIFYDYTHGLDSTFGTFKPPFGESLLISNNVTATNLTTGITPLSQGFLPYQTIGQFSAAGNIIYYFPEHDPDPKVLQRNFSIQQQLTSDTVLTVAYAGTSGEHLYVTPNINQPAPGPGAAGPRRPFPAWSNILANEFASSSAYNGLQVSAERRFSRGLAFLASYTWGHAMDIASTSGYSGVIQNPLCLHCDRGPSDFDIRHSLVLSWSYELPFGQGKTFGKNWNGPLNFIAGGWKINSIDTFQTGSPFTVNSGTNTEGSGGGTQRANVVGDWHVSNPGPSQWFNPAAFTAPPAYTYGNAGRNIIVGPGTNQIDASLFKNIPLRWREGMRMEFRTEAFNLFNKPQFDNPNGGSGTSTGSATSGVPGFGTLNYAGNPVFFQRTSREIQFALKLYY